MFEFLLFANLITMTALISYKLGWDRGHDVGHSHALSNFYGDDDEA